MSIICCAAGRFGSRLLAGDRIGEVAEVDGGGVRQRQHERGEADAPSACVGHRVTASMLVMLDRIVSRMVA